MTEPSGELSDEQQQRGVEFARRMHRVPYVWHTDRFDCATFMRRVMRKLGR